MAADSQIVCQNLSLQFGYQKIFTNLSFELKKSDSLAVVGHNGSGKITLLNIVAGLLKPTSGHVTCCEEIIWPKPLNYRYKHTSIYLGYSPAFYMDQSVSVNLDFYLKCFGCTPEHTEKSDALQTVDLKHKENALVSTLSTGQKKRLILAILKILKPDVVFFDEPTNGLDDNGMRLSIDIFECLQKTQNTSFMIATHDDFLKSWCTQTLCLHQLNAQKHHQKPKVHILL